MMSLSFIKINSYLNVKKIKEVIQSKINFFFSNINLVTEIFLLYIICQNEKKTNYFES